MGSSLIYTAITKHWPKIATGCVVAVGLLEFLVGGLTSDSTLEYYFLAWGGITGGLWFMFDVAEKSISAEVKSKLTESNGLDTNRTLKELPANFAALFDQTFGSKHLSWRCFISSSIASIIAVLLIAAFTVGTGALVLESGNYSPRTLFANIVYLVLGSLIVNAIPDYISLLETRWLIGRSDTAKKFAPLLILDSILTTLIMLLWISLLSFLLPPFLDFPDVSMVWRLPAPLVENAFFIIPLEPAPTIQNLWSMLTNYLSMSGQVEGWTGDILGIFFYSTFFTSLWLWLYASVTIISLILLRLNSGIGLVLRVTDYESQPFRSLGFVSVLLVSGLFLLGLPFVIW